MKNLILLTILSLAVLIFAACQNTEPANTTVNNNATTNTNVNTSENKNTTVTNNPTTTTSTKPAGFPASNLNPESVAADKPIPAEELRNAMLAWMGKEVSVIGYPTSRRIMGSGFSLKGAADDDSGNELIECRNKTQFENQPVEENQPIVVKGIIKTYPYEGAKNPPVELQECAIVSKGEFTGEKGIADASKVDPNKPIPAADLHKDFFKWHGKQVAVTGNYNGHTKSSGTSGNTIDIRIDVQNDKGQKVVGCHIANDPGADDFKERNNRVFKGTIAGASFGEQVTLKPCEYVK
jgi:hypothetical protein